jgi:septum formation protein
MLVLASASPRRQELLRNAGISFTVQPANIDETPLNGEFPVACTERLAGEKALAIWRTRQDDLVLGADTTVIVNGTMLAKPADAQDAARMLRLLSGRTHQVVTGVCLAGPRQLASNKGQHPTESCQLKTDFETTLVTFAELSEKDIREYVSTGEPMDKAGAYAIQGIASRWIPRIEGDYSNVVGLPIALVYRMLRERKFL